MKKASIKYITAYCKMKDILRAYGLSGEHRYFNGLESIDIRMHNTIIGSFELDGYSRPLMRLCGGINIPFFHHDGRKASCENAVRRFKKTCSMISNDMNYTDIANIIFKDIRDNG